MEAIKNWWLGVWNGFAEKHPKAAEWFRKGGLFLIFSYVVTFIKFLLLMFLPTMYRGIVGADAVWTWPGIETELLGIPFTLSIIGNSLADGGLAYTLANFTAIFFGECINFPLQRNVTFKSHGPLVPQILCHLVATIVVMLVMNLFTCVWNPITTALIKNEVFRDAVRNIVLTVATGGVSMVIIFFVDNKIFAPGWGEKKTNNKI